MKKLMKIMMGLALAPLFFAAAARAEVVIEMGIEGYTPSASIGEAARSAQLERLSEAAGRLAAAVEQPRTAAAETLLAGLYAGSVASEAAPAVKADRRALPGLAAPKAAPAPAKPSLKPLMRAEDAPASASVSSSTAPAAGGDKPEEKKEEKKPTLGEMALAGLIGLSLVCLFMLVLL